MKLDSDGFHRTRAISLDAARRRSVGDTHPHVDAPYRRGLVGDRRLSLHERHPQLWRYVDLAVVAALLFASWAAVGAIAWGCVDVWQAVLS